MDEFVVNESPYRFADTLWVAGTIKLPTVEGSTQDDCAVGEEHPHNIYQCVHCSLWQVDWAYGVGDHALSLMREAMHSHLVACMMSPLRMRPLPIAR